MEERRIGEDAVELAGRQVEREEVLLPYLASGSGARHLDEALGAVEPNGHVAERGEGLEVAPRPATEVEDRERRLALDVAQQRGDVLADIVVLGAEAEILGALVVMRQRAAGDLFQLATRMLHPT